MFLVQAGHPTAFSGQGGMSHTGFWSMWDIPPGFCLTGDIPVCFWLTWDIPPCLWSRQVIPPHFLVKADVPHWFLVHVGHPTWFLFNMGHPSVFLVDMGHPTMFMVQGWARVQVNPAGFQVGPPRWEITEKSWIVNSTLPEQKLDAMRLVSRLVNAHLACQTNELYSASIHLQRQRNDTLQVRWRPNTLPVGNWKQMNHGAWATTNKQRTTKGKQTRLCRQPKGNEPQYVGNCKQTNRGAWATAGKQLQYMNSLQANEPYGQPQANKNDQSKQIRVHRRPKGNEPWYVGDHKQSNRSAWATAIKGTSVHRQLQICGQNGAQMAILYLFLGG
ncbi:hypothetical protein B0H13DRAFT_1887604 [Mycena leptocephala]|nr:hypothetical protein B0H13DRAFT_1887604 [Mycena leptocephala]